MNREEIIAMAREAEDKVIANQNLDWKIEFAALVAAAKDAEHAEKLKNDIHSCGPTCTRYACVAVREAVKAERERIKQINAPEIEQVNKELRRLHEENERLKTVPMKYRRMEFNAQLQEENSRLHALNAELLQALSDIAYGLESARIWGGMEWSYNSLRPFKYLPLRDKARAAIATATGETT